MSANREDRTRSDRGEEVSKQEAQLAPQSQVSAVDMDPVASDPDVLPTAADPATGPTQQVPTGPGEHEVSTRSATASPSLPDAGGPTRGAGAAIEAQVSAPVFLSAPQANLAAVAHAEPGESAALPATIATAPGGTQAGSAEGEQNPAGKRPASSEGADAAQSAEPRSPGARSEAPGAVRADGLAGHTEARGERIQSPLPVSSTGAPAGAPPPQAEVNEYAASILRQVRMRLSPQLRQATLQLEPAHLGRLAIRLELRRGVTRAEVVAEQESTFATLEHHLPELRAALAQAGFEGVEIDLRQAGDGAADTPFAPRGEARPGQTPAKADASLAPGVTRAVATRLANTGGVDTYA